MTIITLGEFNSYLSICNEETGILCNEYNNLVMCDQMAVIVLRPVRWMIGG